MESNRQFNKIQSGHKRAIYFTKTKLKRRTGILLNGNDTIVEYLERYYHIAGFIFSLEVDSFLITIEFNNKEIALIHLGNYRIQNDQEMLEIASNFILHYKDDFYSFQNGMSNNESDGYIQISSKYFLTDEDPHFEDGLNYENNYPTYENEFEDQV